MWSKGAVWNSTGSRQGSVAGSHEHRTELLRSIKEWEFLDHLYQLVKTTLLHASSFFGRWVTKLVRKSV